jgi:hypothetical protein
MTDRRSPGIAALLVAAGMTLGGCTTAAQGAAPVPAEEPAAVHEGQDGGPGVVTLGEAAEQRLAIRTTPVAAADGALVVPYAAVVYEPDGSSWAYVQTAPLNYQRQPITITDIAGDHVTLSSGPPVGTAVVTQGAAELVGVETGINGEQ